MGRKEFNEPMGAELGKLPKLQGQHCKKFIEKHLPDAIQLVLIVVVCRFSDANSSSVTSFPLHSAHDIVNRSSQSVVAHFMNRPAWPTTTSRTKLPTHNRTHKTSNSTPRDTHSSQYLDTRRRSKHILEVHKPTHTEMQALAVALVVSL